VNRAGRPLGEMADADAIKRGNNEYRVTWGWLIKGDAQLDIDFRRYSFIDYGSAKAKRC
jgi:hypothetical protein